MKHNSVSHLELKSRTFQLLFIGLISRLAIWMSGVVAAFCVDPYDSSGQIAYRLLYTNKSSTKLDVLTRKLIAPFANWDGIYFLRISEYGYEFEQYHAFFPLYPLCIHVFKEGLALLFGTVLTHETLTLLSAFLLSNTFFLIATLAFYRLSVNVLKSESMSYVAALIFCFNPASIFMSATYTESLFATLTFGGCYYLSEGNTFLAAILFSLASLTRSNGVVLIGFLLYYNLRKFVNHFQVTNLKSPITLIAILVLECVETITLSVLVYLPLSAFQYYSYQLYCTNTTTTSTSRPWCSSGPFLPSFYNFVQSHYWNVGFLKYYTVKQIPNFLLAIPIVLLSLSGIWVYISNNWRVVLTLGLRESKKSDSEKGYLNVDVFVYVVHWGFLLLFACLMMHIQVTTRFLCSQVASLYWFLAHLLLREPPQPFVRGIIIAYLFLFNVIGTLLFVTFYPWT